MVELAPGRMQKAKHKLKCFDFFSGQSFIAIQLTGKNIRICYHGRTKERGAHDESSSGRPCGNETVSLER